MKIRYLPAALLIPLACSLSAHAERGFSNGYDLHNAVTLYSANHSVRSLIDGFVSGIISKARMNQRTGLYANELYKHEGSAREIGVVTGFYASNYCVANEVSSPQLASTLKHYLEANVTRWHSDAAALVEAALESAYPCAQ